MNYHHAYLEEVLLRLAGPTGPAIVARAMVLTHKWDTVPGTDPWFGRRWRELLQQDASEVRAVVMADTEEGRRLRHTMPFAGVLSNAEKAALRRVHGRVLAHR